MSIKSILSTIVFGVIFGILISAKADDGFAPLQGSGSGGSSGPFTKTLQDSYNNGQSIETVGGNAVGFSDLEDDGFTVFNINKSPTTTHAGHAISVSMNAHTTGDGVRVTMANGAAGSAVSAVGGTQTAAAPLYAGTKTWNNSGVTFREIKLNITDTASAVASMFLDFQIAGTSKFSVNKSGALTTTAGTIIPVAAGTVGLAKDAAGGPASFRVYSSSDSVSGSPTNSSYIELFNDDTYTFLRTAKTGTGTARGLFIDAGAGAGRIYIDNSSGGMYTQYGRFGVLPPGSESVRAGYLGIENASDKVYCWYSSSGDLSGTLDTIISRSAAGIISLDTTVTGNHLGKLKMNGTTASGTVAPAWTNAPTALTGAQSPYTWFTFVAPDGTVVYVPAFK